MHNPNIKIHGVHPAPPISAGQGGANQIFKKRGLDKTPTFRGGLLGKRGDFSQGMGTQFSHKK